MGILVVGDRAGVLAKCAAWLREAGAGIEAVEGLAAADAFRVERRPNALVVDPVLSDGDGFFDLALPLVYAPIEERVAVLVVSDRFHDGNHHWVDDTAARALPVDHLSHPEVLVASVLGALRRARLDSRPRCGFTRASTPAAGSIARTRRTIRSAPPRDQEHASPWFLPPPPPLPSQSLLAFGPIHLDYRTREVIVAGRRARLQLRQYDLLLYLLERRGRAISEAEVLRNVWRSHHREGRE